MCRGFGYVTFALSEDAEKAKDTLKTYKGRQLSICFADKKPRHEKSKIKHGEEAAADDNEDNPGELYTKLTVVVVIRAIKPLFCRQAAKKIRIL